MTSSIKKDIILNDSYKNKDLVYGCSPKNELIVLNFKGEQIYRGFNTVVNGGRLYNLQTMSNEDNANSINNKRSENRPNYFMSCFGVGDDGTISNDKSVPKTVAITETELYDKVQFTTEDWNNQDNNNSKPKYRDNRYKKDFDNVTTVINELTGEIYTEFVFTISELELNGIDINEFGFYLSDLDVSNDTKSNFKLFSKVTIPTIFKRETGSLESSYTFKYRIYA